MAYTRGNLAMKERANAEQLKPNRYKETTKVVTRRTGLPPREKFLYLMTVIVCIAIASVLVGRYANIYDLNKQMHTANQSIEKSNKEMAVIEVQKEKLESDIVAKARELGYIEPSSEQEAIRVQRTSVTTGTP